MNARDMVGEVSEHVERLICRFLDGELTAAQRAELNAVLRRDPAARALMDDYARNDAIVASALRRDFENAMTATAPGRGRGLWLATAGSVLAAAAVIMFSALPTMHSPMDGAVVGNVPVVEHFPSAGTGSSLFRTIDYRDVDMRPARRQRDVHRDVIGIRGEDKNKMYVIERGESQTRIVPIAGEF
jgi:hypothetical protein